MSGLEIRSADPGEDAILVRHYRHLWESYGVPDEHIRSDAEACVQRFIQEGRAHRQLGVFLALVDGLVVGSSACQLHLSPYPDVVVPQVRKFGYVWSVFVEAEHRRKGIARHLTERALDHLRQIGCTSAVLHASDAGEPLYLDLGFQPAKEMRLVL